MYFLYRYNNLSYWRARKVVFYKNGDPFFPGVEFRFKPGRDIGSLESLLDKLSLRMDLPRGARYIFSMDGDRKMRLDELEDGASYVVSSYKAFKVSAFLLYFSIFLIRTLVINLVNNISIKGKSSKSKNFRNTQKIKLQISSNLNSDTIL